MVLAGIGLLTIVILILVSSPSSLFSPLTVISDDLDKSSANEIAVITKTDFSDPERIKELPYDIGMWHGKDYNTAEVTEALGANVVLIRGYDPETFTQPLFLNIVQSKTDSSFHRPTICFKSQGYITEELARETFELTSQEWARGTVSTSIPINRLLVTKNSKEGNIIERRLVLYFYVKGNQFNSDMITLIEVQGLVPVHGSYEGTLTTEKDFLSKAIPLMFEPVDNEGQWQPLIGTLVQKGAGGYLIIAVIILVPLFIAIYPVIRRRGHSA